jgi:hypothetical protein
MQELGKPVMPLNTTHRKQRSAAEASFDAALAKGELGMFPGSAPQIAILREKPEHTLALFMFAAGKKDAEVAEALDYTVLQIRNLRKQPWFRSKLDQVIEEAGKEQVATFLQGKVLPALEVLDDIIHDPTQKGATRVTAIREMLDRGLGKSVARVEVKTQNVTPSDATDEVERLRKEVEENARRLSANGIATATFQPSAS